MEQECLLTPEENARVRMNYALAQVNTLQGPDFWQDGAGWRAIGAGSCIQTLELSELYSLRHPPRLHTQQQTAARPHAPGALAAVEAAEAGEMQQPAQGPTLAHE